MTHTISKRLHVWLAAFLLLVACLVFAVAVPTAYAADAKASEAPVAEETTATAQEDVSSGTFNEGDSTDNADADNDAADVSRSTEPATGEPAEGTSVPVEPAAGSAAEPAAGDSNQEPASSKPANVPDSSGAADESGVKESSDSEDADGIADSGTTAEEPAPAVPAASASLAPAPAPSAAPTSASASARPTTTVAPAAKPAKAPAKAASTTDVASLIKTTKKKDGTLEITGLDSSATITSLVIPSTIGGVKVTSIASSAFDGSKLTSITIPNTVTEIGNYAFQNSAITSMVIPKSVKTVGLYAFYNCTALTKLTIKASLEYLPAYFATSSGVKTVKIAAGPIVYGVNSFADCKNLTSVAVPKGVAELMTGSFYKCTSLKKIKLPSTLRIIDSQCFDGCTKLSVTMPYGVCLADQYAFRKVKKLGKVPSYLAKENGIYCRIDQVTVAGFDDYKQAWALLDRENKYRKAHKLGKLKMDKTLLSEAMNKAAGLTTQFRAVLPSATSSDVVVYVAKGCDTAAQAMKLWRKSYKTDNAIAGKKMLYTGIGCFLWGQNRYWVQYFAPKGSYKSKAVAKRSTKQQAMQHTSRFWMDDGNYVVDLVRASAKKYAKSKAYAGGATTQKLTVQYLTSDKAMPLFEGYDYHTAYKGNKKVGKASFTLKPVTDKNTLHNEGKNASAKYAFTITKAGIAKAKASVAAQTYRKGKASKPKLASITYKGNMLKLGRDYRIVKYGNNTKPTKKAWVQIQGKGNYKGAKKVYFTIA